MQLTGNRDGHLRWAVVMLNKNDVGPAAVGIALSAVAQSDLRPLDRRTSAPGSETPDDVVPNSQTPNHVEVLNQSIIAAQELFSAVGLTSVGLTGFEPATT